MQARIRNSIIIINLLFVLICGCSNNIPSELKEIADKEKIWLEQLCSIVEQIKTDYILWENGHISREQLAKRMEKYYFQVKKLRQQSNEFYSQVNLTKEVKKNPIYDNGLYYGQSLRFNIETFLLKCVKGYSNISKNKVGFSDEQLKKFYNVDIKEKYESKIKLLQAAFEKLN